MHLQEGPHAREMCMHWQQGSALRLPRGPAPRECVCVCLIAHTYVAHVSQRCESDPCTSAELVRGGTTGETNTASPGARACICHGDDGQGEIRGGVEQSLLEPHTAFGCGSIVSHTVALCVQRQVRCEQAS